MKYPCHVTSLLASAVILVGSFALHPIPAASAAELGPAGQTLEKPVAAPASAEPQQTPQVPEASAVHRPAAVSDAQYAAEKEAAKTGPAPMGAIALPVPAAGGATNGPSNAASVTLNFLGLNRQTAANNGFVFIPPDTILGKSPNQVIEATNSAIRLFTPSGGVLTTRDLNSFFGASTANGRLFDPKVYFDRNAANRRVYVAALQVKGDRNVNPADNVSRLWVAVSRSPDPTNLTTNWCRYNIDARGEIGAANESWGDFPAIGAGADSFSVALNNFRFTDDSFRFARIHVFNKNILSNNALSCPTVPRFVFQPASTAGDFTFFTLQPAQHYTSPSSGFLTTNPAYYLSTHRGSFNQYLVHRIRNVASGSPTYTRVTLTNRSYGIPPNGSQRGSTLLIDSGDNRVLQVAGQGNTIIGILTTSCNFTSGTPVESCTLTPRVSVGVSIFGGLTASIPENNFVGFGNNVFVHHPGIATDTALRSASTWEFNSASSFLSSAALSKVVNGNWGGTQTYASGTCADTLGGAPVRSGDYTGTQLDPSLSGFWLAGEQAVLINGTCQWQTRIVRVLP